MERTGGYGRPLDTRLEGLCELLGVKAPHIKAVPGRQTDVKDAEWMAERLRHGLLRGRFMPATPPRQLRELTRPRTTLGQDRARVINRWQAVWEDATITRAAVVTDSRGGSVRAMREALIAGQRAVDARADLARGRLRTKRDQRAEA
jgi:transposase